jgi:uncharacterized protein (DUF1499 family)
MSQEGDGGTIQKGDVESRSLLLRDEDNDRYPPFLCHLWWRNPIFYLALLFSLYSGLSLIIHFTWLFFWGIAVSALAAVVFGVGVIYYICSRWNVNTMSFGFTRGSLIKFVFVMIFFFCVQIVLTYYQGLLLKIHIDAPDPDWYTFPLQCRPNPLGSNYTVKNCVRVGRNISNPYTVNGEDPCLISQLPSYNYSLAQVRAMFDHIVTSYSEGLGCRLIAYNSSGFLHARCLTTFAGYPDDLALRIFCNEFDQTDVWIHSQSRLGVWDYNYNDARVRLMLAWANLYLSQKFLHTPSPCSARNVTHIQK